MKTKKKKKPLSKTALCDDSGSTYTTSLINVCSRSANI